MNPLRALAASVALVGVVLLAGCGEKKSTDGGTGDAPPETGKALAQVARASAEPKGADGAAKTGSVSGKVLYQGKPVPDGSVTFYPADGKGTVARGTIKDGIYAVTRVPVGTAKVVISAPRVVGKKRMYDTPDSPTVPITAESLPPEYSDKEKSELTFEVRPGENEKDWELK
jgi:hypothetical protein